MGSKCRLFLILVPVLVLLWHLYHQLIDDNENDELVGDVNQNHVSLSLSADSAKARASAMGQTQSVVNRNPSKTSGIFRPSSSPPLLPLFRPQQKLGADHEAMDAAAYRRRRDQIHKVNQTLLVHERPAVYPDDCSDDSGPRNLSPVPPIPPGDTTSIHIFVKGSSSEGYAARSRWIADSWGRDVLRAQHEVTFVLDGSNMTFEDELRADGYGVASLVETKTFGNYRNGNGKDSSISHKAPIKRVLGEMKNHLERTVVLSNLRVSFNELRYRFAEAYEAQRLKTRWVLKQPIADSGWICYLDDDLVINITNLVADLRVKIPLCAPYCWVGQVARQKESLWMMGGWCMEAKLVQRIQQEFLPWKDIDVGWRETDDLGLMEALTGVLNIVPFNSDRWLIDHRPDTKPPKWFNASRRHQYAVYHQVDLPPSSPYPSIQHNLSGLESSHELLRCPRYNSSDIIRIYNKLNRKREN